MKFTILFLIFKIFFFFFLNLFDQTYLFFIDSSQKYAFISPEKNSYKFSQSQYHVSDCDNMHKMKLKKIVINKTGFCEDNG